MSKPTKKDRRRLAKSLNKVLNNPSIPEELFDAMDEALVDLQNRTQAFLSTDAENIRRWVPGAVKKDRKIRKREDTEIAAAAREELTERQLARLLRFMDRKFD